MIPITVRIEIVGTIHSVIAGGPSKKVSSGLRAAADLAAALGFATPPLRFPRLAYQRKQRRKHPVRWV
jgi:hypothetical protein